MKISPKQYAQTLYDLTAGKREEDIAGLITRFVAQLRRDGQVKNADQIIAHFEDIYNAAHDIVVVSVTTAFPLNDDQKADIQKYIANMYDAEKVIVDCHVDRAIKGGIIMRVGDDVIDASVGHRLRRLTMALQHQ